MLGSYKICELLLSLEKAPANRRGWSDCRFYPTLNCQSPDDVQWLIKEALPYLKQKNFIYYEDRVKIVAYDITAHDIFFHNFFEHAHSSAKALAELCGLRNLWSLVDEEMSVLQFVKVIQYKKYEDLRMEYEWDLIHNTCVKVKLLKRGVDWINTNRVKMIQLTTRTPEKERNTTSLEDIEPAPEVENITFDADTGELYFDQSKIKVRFKKGTKMYDLLLILWNNLDQDMDVDDLEEELRTAPNEHVDVIKRAHNIKKKIRGHFLSDDFLTINSNEQKIRVAPNGYFDPIRPTKWL
jgi:hypothetical protein